LSNKNKEFILLEASYIVGGRQQTIKNKEGAVLYEAGAWRVHSSHTRVLKLCKKLGLKLKFFEKQKRKKEIKNIAGLTKLDCIMLENEGNLEKALDAELQTGYQQSLSADSTIHPYDVNTKTGEYYVIEKGQDAIIDLLLKTVDKKRIKLQHRVVDFQRYNGGYQVKVFVAGSEIKEKLFYTKYLFSCIPQFYAWSWTPVRDFLYPLFHSVVPQPLHHIYARGKGNFKNKRIMTRSVVEQIIPSAYDNEWFQISYSAGRAANFWNRYKLKYGVTKLKLLLEKYTGFKLKEIKSYYWSYGYHMWRSVPQFDVKKAVAFSIEPNPIKLPNFYWAGECFSSFQGWCEGALETANMALKCWLDKKHAVKIYKNIPRGLKEYMILDSRILDVKKFKLVHPGSTQLIVKHLKEDISLRFRFIKHTSLSWAILYSLQKGFLKKD